MDIETSVRTFRDFCGGDITATLARIESSISGTTTERLADALLPFRATELTLASAGRLKTLVGQLNVVIHAVGILLCLPKILEPGETVESVSLGAGNTGRLFDLETDRRVAEFKFIRWQGGAETIRQNGLFKDFYLLAEHDTEKQRFLYVLETYHPLKFLNGGRSLESVLSKNIALYRRFQAQHGDRYRTVREYYQSRQSLVTLQDVSPWLDGLMSNEEAEADL